MIQNMTKQLWGRATETQNDYGEVIKTYATIGSVYIFIAFSSNTEKDSYQVLYDDYTHIGLTRETSIQKGDIIGGKYLVKYTLPSRPFFRIFLEEIDYGAQD